MSCLLYRGLGPTMPADVYPEALYTPFTLVISLRVSAGDRLHGPKCRLRKGIDWPLAADSRWPFNPASLYRKIVRGEFELAAEGRWPLDTGGR